MRFLYLSLIMFALVLIFWGIVLWIRYQRKNSVIYRTQAEQQDILIQMIMQDERALEHLIQAEQKKRPEASKKELRQLVMYRLQSGLPHFSDSQGVQQKDDGS